MIRYFICLISMLGFGQKTISTAFVVVDGVYNSELIAPLDILEHSRYHSPEHFFKCFVVSPNGKPIKTAEGLTIHADFSFANCPAIDVLIIPSTETSMTEDLKEGPYIQWVSQQVDKAQVVLTLCDGAFPLAQTGRLNGLNATTFPGDQERFAAMFPQVKVHRDVLFVHDGKFITSVGGAKSYEPAIYLAQQWFGEKVAKGLARGLVIEWDLARFPYKTFGVLPAKP